MMISFVIPVRKYVPGDFRELVSLCAEMREAGIGSEIIAAEGRVPSRQRNEGVLAAKGDVVYFLDDDVRITAGHFRALRDLYADDTICAAGGPVTVPRGASLQEKVFGAVFASLFGGCLVRYRHKAIGGIRRAGENMLILADFSVRRNVFASLEKGFREELYPNEENELITRLNQKGLKVLYVPALGAERTLRSTLPSFVRMCLRNGRGRADCLFINPATLCPAYLVPAVFVVYLITLPASGSRIYFLPAALYPALDVVFSLAIALEFAGPPAFFIALAAFPCMHLSYGAGFLYGLFKNVLARTVKRKTVREDGEVKIFRP